ncbi:MAG: PAS domain S-box protein [Desulfuromonadales bacterium]|nr:PAS domain S-box protein [Desulfuromonadales bacterium]
MNVAGSRQDQNINSNSSSKMLMHNILQAIPDLISVIDRNFKIVYSNWRGGHEYAAPKKRKNNKQCYEVYYPDLNSRCDPCHLVQVFETGETIVTEKFNPTVGHLEIHAFPICDESGNVVMAGEYLRNISDRKRAEHALREANQMLEALINASPLTIFAMDLDINMTLWNPAAERMFGWKKEEVLGKPYPLITIEQIDELNESIRLCIMGENRRSMETRRLHKDGHFIDVSVSTAPMLSSEGVSIGYVGIMADISELKLEQRALRESEANYRAIFDASNDAIFVFDVENGAILDVNQKMCQMYGYLREEVLLLTVEELSAGFPPYTQRDALKHIWNTRDNNSHMIEWLAKDRSSRLFWVEVNMKGAVIGGTYKVLGVARDITERKIAEENNRIMQERLLQANKMAAIGTLASGIAHEINNPNNFILSNAQFFADIWPDINRILTRYGEDNGEYFLGKFSYHEAATVIPKMIDGLTEGAYRIKGIVTGLKDFARQEKTRLDQLVDINKVVEAALAMLHNKIKQHTDNFSCTLGKALPPVKGSFRQLEQVIVNLTMNALEALPDRNCAVSITTSYSEYLGQITIKVNDEGVGMTEDVQKAIFDPFFTTKLDSGGTGLGLSINFSIVKEHNGNIECDSKPGRGTAFYVRIPAVRFETEENNSL